MHFFTVFLTPDEHTATSPDEAANMLWAGLREFARVCGSSDAFYGMTALRSPSAPEITQEVGPYAFAFPFQQESHMVSFWVAFDAVRAAFESGLGRLGWSITGPPADLSGALSALREAHDEDEILWRVLARGESLEDVKLCEPGWDNPGVVGSVSWYTSTAIHAREGLAEFLFSAVEARRSADVWHTVRPVLLWLSHRQDISDVVAPRLGSDDPFGHALAVSVLGSMRKQGQATADQCVFWVGDALKKGNLEAEAAAEVATSLQLESPQQLRQLTEGLKDTVRSNLGIDARQAASRALFNLFLRRQQAPEGLAAFYTALSGEPDPIGGFAQWAAKVLGERPAVPWEALSV